MYTVLLKFSFKDKEEIDTDLIEWVVSGFYQNAQLIDYFHFPVIGDNLITYNGIIIQPEVLDPKYYTELTTQRIKRLKEEYHTEFNYEITSQAPSNLLDNLQDTTGLILHYGGYSPIRSLDNFYNVPLYLLPKTSFDRTNYHNIICWQRNFEAMEEIWFRGHEDEQYFFDQLNNYKSGLSRQGLELCAQITDLTKKECYYSLFRNFDPDVPEIENCPKCNSPWKMKEELFDRFIYKCTKCLLIS